LLNNKDIILESKLNIQEEKIKRFEEKLVRLEEKYKFQIKKQVQELEKIKQFISLIEAQQDRLFELSKKTVRPFIPEKIIFCGEEVPLNRFEVRERLEWVLFNEINRWGMCLIFLRSDRWFPMIEEKIKQLNLPEDLKYVAAAESDLNPEACSSAGAVGIWQFTIDTAKRICGLRVDSFVDERRDFEKATEAALKHLQELYSEFGDWPSALASYNIHSDKYKKRIKEERAQDFYSVRGIPLETRRYIFRVIAIKLIMENPKRYGFPSVEEINKIKYQPYSVSVKMVTVNYRIERIIDIAQRLGMTYYEFRTLNPHLAPVDARGRINKDYLPRGKYRVYIKKDP